MSDEPTPPKPPEENWLEQETAERTVPKAPMFYSDMSKGQRRKRSRDRAFEKSKRENLSRNFKWLGIVLAFIAIGVLGFFIGRYYDQGMQTEPVAPVVEIGRNFEATPGVLKHANDAFEFKEKRDYASAFESLQKIVEAQPDAPGVYYQLAETAFKLKNFKQAEIYAEQGIQKNNQPDLCEMVLALIAWQRRNEMNVFANDKIAITTAEKSVKMNPFGTYPLYFLAEFKRESGAYAEGSKLLADAARRVDPLDSLIILRTKAGLAQVQSQRDAVRDGKIPREIVKMNSSNLDQRMCQALVYLYQGKSEEAAKTLKDARAILPAELFMILINDPSFREFQLDPLLQEFFKMNAPEKSASEAN